MLSVRNYLKARHVAFYPSRRRKEQAISNFYRVQRTTGLTLIEVLIALAIISIAMTAIIKTTTQSIQTTAYLQEKMIATWVGEQALNEARVGLLTLLNTDTPLKQVTTMFNREWHWQLTQEDTPNPRIKKIEVQVYPGGKDEDDEESPLVSLESYVYRI